MDLQVEKLTHVDEDAYASLLRQCSQLRSLKQGKILHECISRGRYRESTLLNNLIVKMYGRCGQLEDARQVFDKMPVKNVYTWNIMLSAYSTNGHLLEARKTFDETPKKSLVSYNAMLAAYAKDGKVGSARAMFDSMTSRDVVSWNTVLAAYAQNGEPGKAISLLLTMDQEGVVPNKVSFVVVLDACANAQELRFGDLLVREEAVSDLIAREVVLGTAAVNMYGKCGDAAQARWCFNRMEQVNSVTWNVFLSAFAMNGHVEEAEAIFNRMPQRDHISWNLMMLAYGWNNRGSDAILLFKLMELEGVSMDSTTFSHILNVCTAIPDFDFGRTIHRCCLAGTRVMRERVAVATAVVDLYGKCGQVAQARKVFDDIRQRDVVAWNAMLAAYAQAGHVSDALALLASMDLEGVTPNDSSLVSAVEACTVAAAGGTAGRTLFAAVAACGNYSLTAGGKLWNAFVNMYARCGDLARARAWVESLAPRDEVSWNSVLSAFAQLGHTQDALDMFYTLLIYGVTPSESTFTSVISACSHRGMVADARDFMVLMLDGYGIAPSLQHYQCMVDALCRVGKLQDARDLVHAMPFEPGKPAWTSLVSACSLNGEAKLAAEITNSVTKSAPSAGSGLFVPLSTAFAVDGMR